MDTGESVKFDVCRGLASDVPVTYLLIPVTIRPQEQVLSPHVDSIMISTPFRP